VPKPIGCRIFSLTTLNFINDFADAAPHRGLTVAVVPDGVAIDNPQGDVNEALGPAWMRPVGQLSDVVFEVGEAMSVSRFAYNTPTDNLRATSDHRR